MTYILLASIIVMLASLVGVISLWKGLGHVIERNLHFLVSFSAGVFLVVTYSLAQEALEHASSLGVGLAWIFAGALFIWTISRVFPAVHTHPEEHEHEYGSVIKTKRLLISDALHNLGDGIFLAASFAVSPMFGVTASISVFIHEILQEISEFFVLRNAGFSTKRALIVNFAISSTILIGAIGGFFVLDLFEVIEAPLLGISAGAFLVVVLYDLIPHSIRDARKPLHYAQHLGWFIAGLLIMFFISSLTPHS